MREFSKLGNTASKQPGSLCLDYFAIFPIKWVFYDLLHGFFRPLAPIDSESPPREISCVHCISLALLASAVM